MSLSSNQKTPLEPPKRSGVAYFAFQFYKWLIYVPLLTLSMCIAAVLVLIFCRAFPHFSNRVFAAGWCRFNTLTSFVDIEEYGREHIDPKESYIIVSNHLSQFDIFVLYGTLGLDLRWVMKQELRRIPLFGVAAEAIGHIYINRNDREQAVQQLQAARDAFRPGSSIIFFPEGTRGDGQGLLPFKSGAFQMAKQLDLAILPIRLSGTDHVLPNKTGDLYPSQVRMEILPPFSKSEVNTLSVEQLKILARKRIAGT